VYVSCLKECVLGVKVVICLIYFNEYVEYLVCFVFVGLVFVVLVWVFFDCVYFLLMMVYWCDVKGYGNNCVFLV